MTTIYGKRQDLKDRATEGKLLEERNGVKLREGVNLVDATRSERACLREQVYTVEFNGCTTWFTRAKEARSHYELLTQRAE
jgi:hypothetical protein